VPDWKKLLAAAKVSVTGSQLRDGAWTAAVEAGVSENLCLILVGHASGLQDNYVKRNPKMVAPPCEAIWKQFAK